ncbi:glycosyltransferase [Candidatus Woesearchaeota archaeon]|nr:glycosyltransferase [Candidatus Woesearchaeota archaeon]
MAIEDLLREMAPWMSDEDIERHTSEETSASDSHTESLNSVVKEMAPWITDEDIERHAGPVAEDTDTFTTSQTFAPQPYREGIDRREAPTLRAEHKSRLTSIVVLSYDRKQDLEKCVNSIYSHTRLPFELVIWDNGSNQATLDYLRSIDGKTTDDGNGRVRVVYHGENIGCSRGRNQAVKLAEGDYIVTLDNDIEVTAKWLEPLIATAESDDEIGAVSSKLVYPDKSIQANGGFIQRENGDFAFFKSYDGWKQGKDSSTFIQRDCGWLPGGALLVKKNVARKVEHDPECPNGYEDLDYSLQITNQGHRLVNCPSSLLIHHHISGREDAETTEAQYLAGRRDPRTLWNSLLTFYNKNGLNPVKASPLYRAKGFNGLGADRALCDFSDQELEAYMKSCLEARRAAAADSFGYEGLASIIILSFERAKELTANIRSLYQNTDVPFEVVVFDNGSQTQETIDLLAELDGATKPDGNGMIRVIRNGRNEGCSAGRRKAVEHISPDSKYVVTMDDDMTYAPGWLNALITRVDSSGDIAAASAEVVYPNGIVQWNGGRIEHEFEGLSRFVHVDYFKSGDDLSLAKEMDCDWICGGATIMKRAVLSEARHKSGDVYPNGYEDYDYALQLRQKGWRIVNCPDSAVYHHHAGYDPRKMKQLNRNHAAARRNKETLQRSAFRFLAETGLDVLYEYKGSKWYSAMDTPLEGLPKVTRARLCREEVRRRGLRLKGMGEGVILPAGQYHAEVRQAVKERYGFDSLDIEAVGREGVERAVRVYENAFQTNAASYDIKKIAGIAYEKLSGFSRLLKESSPDAYKYFDLGTGVLADGGIDEVVKSIVSSCTPIAEGQEWAVEMVAWVLLQNDLKYLTVDQNPALNTSELRGDALRDYENANAALRGRNFERAVLLYEKAIEAAPANEWAYYSRGVALLNLGKKDEAKLSLNHTLEINPENDLAREALEGIR